MITMAGRSLVICLFGLAVLSHGGLPPSSAQRQSPTTNGNLDDEVVKGPIGARLDEYLSRATAFGFTGTVLVAIGETPILHKGYSLADRAAKKPNTSRTIYDIGSITKTLTAMGILLLESQGKLSIEDKIGRFLSGVPDDKEEIRLRHLLTHTSGINDPPLGDYEPIGRDELMKVVLAAPLGAEIGKSYNYSNTGFSMLAAIIEKVTGLTYEQFMRKTLFLPAGMMTTGYVLPQWDTRRIAHTYTLPVDHGSPLERLQAAKGPGWILMGNGGVLGTTGDLFRWELALRKGKLIPAGQVAIAFQPHFKRSAQESVGYDWQISTSKTGEVSYGHASDAGYVGLCGWYGRYPAHDATIILLANNRLNGASTRHFVVPNLYKMIAGDSVAVPPPTHQISAAQRKVEGTYALDRDNAIEIKWKDGVFELGAWGQSAVDLFNARQGPEAVAEAQRLNRRAAEFLTALQRQDGEVLEGYLGQPNAEGFLAEWRAALGAHGNLRNSEVLGTFRLDRRAFLTTARLFFDKGPLVIRFGWRGDMVAANSEDLRLTKLAGPLRLSPVPYAAWSPYWYVSDDRLFTFDLLTGTPLQALVVGNGSTTTELRFEAAAGKSPRWLRR